MPCDPISPHCDCLYKDDFEVFLTPHVEDGSPAAFACSPRYARVKGDKPIIVIFSTTDNQSPPTPRKEGEAGARPFLRQVRDEAGVGGRAREQFNT